MEDNATGKGAWIIGYPKSPGRYRYIIDKSQFLKTISVIDKLSPIIFSYKCCGKFSMCLTKFFFCKSNCKNVFSRFFKKRKQFTDSAVITKQRDSFLKLQQVLMDIRIFQ